MNKYTPQKDRFKEMLLKYDFKQTDEAGYMYANDEMRVILYMSYYAIRPIRECKEEENHYSFPTFPLNDVMFESDMIRIQHDEAKYKG